jgi:hypothetical protein
LLVAGSKDPTVAAYIERGYAPAIFRRSLSRFKTAISIYQPWIEGLALFAQWDALPGHAKVASGGMLDLASLEILSDTSKRRGNPQDYFARVGQRLQEARSSDEASKQKIDLLALPLNDPNGGYLAGYLGVKSIYHSAVAVVPLFEDSDFFVSWLGARLFHDPLAAAILFDVEMRPAEWLEMLLARLADRLAAIMHHASRFCSLGWRPHAIDPSVWIGLRQLAVQRIRD